MNRKLRRANKKIGAAPAASSASADMFAEAVRHHQAGRWAEAETLYRALLRQSPTDVDALYNLGLTLQLQNKLEDAVITYRQAIALQPEHARSYMNLGAALQDLGRLEEAVAALRKTVALEPNGKSLVNISGLLQQLDRWDEGLAAGREAIALDPRDPTAHYNVGSALVSLGRIDDAIQELRQAIALRPDFPEGHFTLAQCLLMTGQFAPGWDEYEWRWKLGEYAWAKVYRDSPVKLWNGEPLAGRSILIHAEQGLGDTIQFIRYLPRVVALAAKVVLVVHPQLRHLLRDVEGVTLMGLDERQPLCDFYCPLLSLPRLFATRVDSIPAPIPYLRADPAAIAHWQARLGDGLKVGIAWQGKPGTVVDRGRSVDVASFAPLARIPGVRLISLQKNQGTEQLAGLPPDMRIDTLGPDFDAGPAAFRDTAAVMTLVDLVITTDTSVAHLAGALGRPTWVVLKFAADWRWLRQTERSPWYPTMRLFRQAATGAWNPVFERVAGELARWPETTQPPHEAPIGDVTPPPAGAVGSPPARDFSRFDRFLDGLASDVYPEPPAEPHLSITRGAIDELHRAGLLSAGMRVLDIGCGQGLALEQFQALGLEAHGITLGADAGICRAKGFDVHDMDQNFMDFDDGSFDILWCRHVLEHSVAPLFTLSEYKRVTKPRGLIYVEVPAPDTSAHHETNVNHYSVLTISSWLHLFARVGFAVERSSEIRFTVPCGPDLYWSFWLRNP